MLVGLLVYFLWSQLCRLLHWTAGHAIGWSCVIAVIISAGIDAWKLFYMGIVRLESPLYARIFWPPSTIPTSSAAVWCWKSPVRSPVLLLHGCCSVRGHRKNRRLTQVFVACRLNAEALNAHLMSHSLHPNHRAKACVEASG